MDILDLVFRARTAELDQAEKKLDDVGKKAEQAERKAKGLGDTLGGFGKLGGPIGNVANSVSDLTDKADTSIGTFGKLGGSITLVGVAAVAAVAGVVKLSLDIADMADAMNDLSNRSNISTERLSLLDAMAKMAGSSVEELVGSAEKLAMKLAKQDEETGRVATALKSLGISTKDANGETKSMLTLQEEVVLAVDKAADSAKAEGAAITILGTDYYKLRTAIKETAEQKSVMYDYMQKVGSVVTTKLAKDSDTLNDNVGKLGLSFKGMGMSIASAVIPVLNSLIEKITTVAEKAADIIRRYTGNSTASELSADALSKLQTDRDNAMATVKKIEGTAYADSAAGAKALEQARAQVTAVNDQIREMTKLKVAADGAAAAVKAAVTDGTKTEGSRVAAGSGSTSKDAKTDPLAWMKEPEYVAALSKAQTLANEKNKDYNYATEQGIQNSISYQDQLRKQAAAFQTQADAVRDMLDPQRELNREIEKVMNNPLLSDDEKGAAIVGLSLKWEESMGRMKNSTQELSEFATKSFDMLGTAISDMAFDADFSFKNLALSFSKMVFDMLVVQPMIEGLKKSLQGLSSGGSSGTGIWGAVLGALGGMVTGSTTTGTTSGVPANPYYTGRANGGPVSAGQMYEVNERSPELLNVGNKQYLMMGAQHGSVSPMRGGASASGGITWTGDINVEVTGGGSDAKHDGRAVGDAAAKAFIERIADARIANATRMGGLLNR